MTTEQRIVRVRRQYNQWVGNQTLEDFALRFTAKTARKWSSGRVVNTALGAISFLALEAIGGAITLSYGFSNAVVSILVVGLLIFLTGAPISYYAARYGVDIDLLTRGAGFGYIGSTITSLIYASFTFIFFAFEGAIMALALELCFGIPLWLGYLLSALVVIPLVTHGITFISRFQLWTQPLWVVLQLAPFVFIGAHGLFSIEEWTTLAGTDDGGGFDLLLFGAAASVLFSLIAQIGEQVDFLRFLPRRPESGQLTWWTAFMAAGPGWILLGVVKLLAGSFLAVLAVGQGVPVERAAEPTQMYLAVFHQMFMSPDVAVAITGIFVIVAQLKINVTNAYAGSIAWSNFFSRLTHSHPGRVVWLVFNVTIALFLMQFGVYEGLEHTLGLYSNVAVAWVGTIVADLVVNKPLGLSPPHIEFKRAHLYDINPVGVGAMGLASVASVAAYAGAFGPDLKALSSFLALGLSFVLAPLIAWATGGRYYIAREPAPIPEGSLQRCCICEHHFEPEDMAHCPVYSGPICSLCCSLDARCHDACKTGSRFPEQVTALFAWALPDRAVARLNSRLGQYLTMLATVATAAAIVLSLIYLQATLETGAPRAVIADTLWKVFFIFLLVAGVATWLFVLVHESRRVAQEESVRQTNLLMREIRAHQRTDAELQKAKEVAEAANHAKSRYVVGISHELRSPLNAILGYAQILEHDPDIPARRVDALRTIRRSGEHLAGLIEGLLDISKIEAGRLNIYRDEVRIADFLDQLADMFRMQAEAKGIEFRYMRDQSLPERVRTDEKRLRQILINLLSNAIKCTDHGHVTFRMCYRSEIGDFSIEDTGIGIRETDLERIFKPFERVEEPKAQRAPGTGLGLTITQLLTDIMGGEITVSSVYGQGSVFRVKLMLSAARVGEEARPAVAERRIHGYRGRRLTVLVADDDPDHRGLMASILEPLGFTVVRADSGNQCLELARAAKPDLFLLDVSMPAPGGWEVAERLREEGHHTTPIVMVSANAADEKRHALGTADHDAFVAKPIRITELLDHIGRLLKLEWICEPETRPNAAAVPSAAGAAQPTAEQIGQLRALGQIGHVRGIRTKLDEIETETPALAPVTARLRALVDKFELVQYDAVLESMQSDQVG